MSVAELFAICPTACEHIKVLQGVVVGTGLADAEGTALASEDAVLGVGQQRLPGQGLNLQ